MHACMHATLSLNAHVFICASSYLRRLYLVSNNIFLTHHDVHNTESTPPHEKYHSQLHPPPTQPVVNLPQMIPPLPKKTFIPQSIRNLPRSNRSLFNKSLNYVNKLIPSKVTFKHGRPIIPSSVKHKLKPPVNPQMP